MEVLAGLTGLTATDAVVATESAQRATAAAPGFGTALAKALAGADEVGDTAMPAVEDGNATPFDGTEAANAAADDPATALAASLVKPEPATKAATEPANAPVRSTEPLVPEMRSRLERVLHRMREELGYDVRVVETYRTQERQEQLYAQGRTTDGPVVTWTRDSNHTRGRAVDLLIVGGRDADYRQLARIAAEEGLNTLGARDPGHLELPANVPDGAEATDLGFTRQRGDFLNVARVASVARTARIAGVAEPAATTDVARPAAVASVAQLPETAAIAAVARVSSVAQTAQPAQSAPVASVANVAMPAQPPAAAYVAPVANVAQVAEPSVIARIAIVARPARVASLDRAATTTDAPARASGTPELTGRLGRASADAPDAQPLGTAAPAGDPARVSATAAAESNEGEPRLTRDDARRGAEPASQSSQQTPEESAVQLLAQQLNGNAQPRAAAEATGNDIAARVARMVALQDAKTSQPTAGITLHVDGMDGAPDARIRLGLRGAQLDTTIEVKDPIEALRLASRGDELRQVLEKHGLEPAMLRIRESLDATATNAWAPGTTRSAIKAETEFTGQNTGNLGRRDSHSQEQRQGRRNTKEDRR